MLRIWGFVTLLLLTITTSLLAYQNEPDGFRNMKWGTSINEFKNLKLLKSAELKTYSKANEELIMGDIPLKFIHYDFWNNKLTRVSIRVEKGKTNFTNMVNVFKVKFGIPRYNQYSGSEVYSWDGTDTHITLDYSNKDNYTDILMLSPKVENEKFAFVRNAEKDALAKTIKARQEKADDDNKRAEKGAKKGF